MTDQSSDHEKKLPAHRPSHLPEGKKNQMIAGAKAGMNIAIGSVPIALSFGILSVTGNPPMPLWAALLMSVLVYSAAAQFNALDMLQAGSSGIQIAVTTFFINIKSLLTSATATEKMDQDIKPGMRAALGFGITDQTFSLLSTSDSKIKGYYALGLEGVSYILWILATLVGILFGGFIPASILSALGIAVYAMYLVLTGEEMLKLKIVLLIFAAAAVMNSFIDYIPILRDMPSSFSFIIIPVICAAIGAYYMERKTKKDPKKENPESADVTAAASTTVGAAGTTGSSGTAGTTGTTGTFGETSPTDGGN
ncbi:AzlC family ABC transporter permease [Methanolapillus africanus]|uniref:AzlC family ABC transporter permease n=1 Tax=Methanolapillus africanus TaxID=3028297 RepID=UPI0030B912FD